MNNINLEDIFIKCIEYSNKIKNIDLRDCCQKILRDYKEKLIKNLLRLVHITTSKEIYYIMS